MRSGAWFVRRVWDNGLPLDAALFTRFINFLVHSLPPGVVNSQFRREANARFDHALYGLAPAHEISASSAVTNDDLPCRILSGCVQVRPGIARLTSSAVEFTDGTRADDVDAVICATGKRLRPFIYCLICLLARDAQASPYCRTVSVHLCLRLCVCPRQLESRVCTQHCASRATSTTGMCIYF